MDEQNTQQNNATNDAAQSAGERHIRPAAPPNPLRPSAPKSFGVGRRLEGDRSPQGQVGAQRPEAGGERRDDGAPRGERGGGGDRRGGKRGEKRGGGRQRPDRPRPEYDQKSIDVRRVARVVAGGRRFSFSVAMIVGDRKGKVGVGTGKAGDISHAMDKAAKDAKKHIIIVKTTKSGSIPHRVYAKDASAIVEITPAPSRGLVAGSSVRNVLELAGITDVNAKIRSGSKNRLSMARAAVRALSALRPRRQSAPKEEPVKENV